MNEKRVCEICGIGYHCKGLCMKHYQKKRYDMNPQARKSQLKSNMRWARNNPKKVKQIRNNCFVRKALMILSNHNIINKKDYHAIMEIINK